MVRLAILALVVALSSSAASHFLHTADVNAPSALTAQR